MLCVKRDGAPSASASGPSRRGDDDDEEPWERRGKQDEDGPRYHNNNLCSKNERKVDDEGVVGRGACKGALHATWQHGPWAFECGDDEQVWRRVREVRGVLARGSLSFGGVKVSFGGV